MRIIATGTKFITRRLILALVGSEFELVCPSDLVVVDSLAKGVETTCRRIREVGSVPIVLMVGQERPDWKEMQSLDINGYIPRGVNEAELVARLRAVLRRFWPANELKNEPCARAPKNFNKILAPFL